MTYFSVAYQPLAWRLPDFMAVISTDPAGPAVADLSERYPHLTGRGAELSEFATLFALRRLLTELRDDAAGGPLDEMTGISHYRRFAVTRPTPGGSQSFAYDMVTPAAFARLPADLFLPAPGVLVVPAPVDVGAPLVTQYGGSHVMRDLLHFMALAVDLGVVDDQTVAWYLGQRVMIPAPTVGVYPTEWLLRSLEAVERVVHVFEDRVGVPREGYQRRAVGFCLERLFSLLVMQLTGSWAADRVVQHRALVISDELVYRDSEGLTAEESALRV